MTTWSGWQSEFLNAAHVPDDAANRAFLTAWAAHANAPNCRNNPIDLSQPETGSGNCTILPGGKHAQHYPSHASAATAFVDQIFSQQFQAIGVGLAASNITTSNLPQEYIDALNLWGSHKFALFAAGQSGQKPPKVPVPLHKGWNDVRHSVNTTAHKRLAASQRLVSAALRKLEHTHKVKGK